MLGDCGDPEGAAIPELVVEASRELSFSLKALGCIPLPIGCGMGCGVNDGMVCSTKVCRCVPLFPSLLQPTDGELEGVGEIKQLSLPRLKR